MVSQRIGHSIVWFLALLSGFVACLFIAWKVMAASDYGYPLFYDVYDINEHIERYAPQNRHISGFQVTDRQQHEALFSAIVTAVHNQGEGLEEITFLRGDDAVTLLRHAEVVHLQDVANLIDVFDLAGVLALVLFILLAGILVYLNRPPSWKHQLMLLAGVVLVCTATVLAIGPKTVFYKFHVWLFPPQHQWFFYYQDSLMTTLMHAPQLFGGIAAVMLLMATMLAVVLIRALMVLAAIRTQQGSKS